MKIYTLQTKQFLPMSLEEAWKFFSSPANLAKITPEHMGFKILHISKGPEGEKMYQGQLIRYKVNVLPFISVHWVTEITHVDESNFFVDEQRFGPYALWHHQHHFKAVEAGVEMRDEVNYAIPFGLLGRLANWLFVGKQVHAIFAHRYQVLEKRFAKVQQEKMWKLS